MLVLPPPYVELALRELGDAFARAVVEAEGGAGAGLLVWVRRSDTVDCAVILEPEETLSEARRVLQAGLVAVADALAAISPPEKPITLVWPDAVHFDAGLVGGGRIAWPQGCAENGVPDWLVFGFTLRAELPRVHGPVPPTALIAEGFDDFETAPFIESFARHFMQVLDTWSQAGPDAMLSRWRGYGEVGDASAPQAPSWLVDGEIAP